MAGPMSTRPTPATCRPERPHRWLPGTMILLLCAGGAWGADLGDDLRALAAQAAASNPLDAPPLRPAADWTASTDYEAGVVVRNGANLYLCRSSGTSAASGGPTGMGAPGTNADIADGSAEWVYAGPPVVTTADPAAPTVSSTPTLPGGLTSHAGPVAQAGSFRFAGGIPTLNGSLPGSQVSFPCVTINAGGTGGNIGLNNGRSCYGWSATWVTDAPQMAIGVSYNRTPANIIIDGRRLLPGGVQGGGGGNPAYFVLDFTAAGGRAARTITIEDYGNIGFAGVWVDPASTVSAPIAARTIRAAFFGSSIECGGNSFPLRGDLGWTAQAAKLLGWQDARNLGLGGTGYINSQGGTALNYAGHIADATAIAPDVVVVGGPINDQLETPAAITAAAAAFLGQVRTALPGTLIIALGTFPAASGPADTAISAENAVAAAVLQLADPLTRFVPLSTDPDGLFLSGTGNVSAPTGTGTADLYISDDGTHPTQAGIDATARHIAARISSLVLSSLGVSAPSIITFSPVSGPVGGVVTLNGSFTGTVTGVSFAGQAAVFTADPGHATITATVPAGAVSGAITVTTTGGSATSTGSFTVTVPTGGGGSGGDTASQTGSGDGSGCGHGATAGLLLVVLLVALRRRT